MFTITPINGSFENIDGVFCGGVNCGLKEDGFDLAFLYSKEPLVVDAIFTDNRFCAAPIKHFKRYKDYKTNFLLANSKNANALTGDEGIIDIDDIFSSLDINLINPIMSSTGVIGVRLDKQKIIDGIKKFNFNSKDGVSFAKAIMTTDSYEKYQTYEVKHDKGSFKISAVAKGAGMISPSMATMLCFIVTDAKIPQSDLKDALLYGVKTTFNAISVDGDKSTNDSVFLLSTQKAPYNKEAFFEAIKLIMQDMALKIISDGEGAKKVVAFEVSGAKDESQAIKASSALANSLLVKTALFGEDPNWGRIASTIGASKVECDEKKLSISFEDIIVYDKGKVIFDKETEKKAALILKKDSFKIKCDLGVGESSFIYYGCDLGYDYVKINADYRT